MNTLQELRNDAWVRLFWRTCPLEFLVYIFNHIVPAVRQSRDPHATHTILRDFQQTGLYLNASQSHQRRLHCLIGRVVRIARGFDVETTAGGSPQRMRVEGCPHRSFTVQRPPLPV